MNTFKKLTSKIIKHQVNADIKYSDYFNNNKKYNYNYNTTINNKIMFNKHLH